MATAIGTVLNEVRQRLPLTDYLASKGYGLRQTGRNRMVALCPFHADRRRPNMVIYADEQRFHCFACLDANEPIWTATGLRAIGSVHAGDVVLDHAGQLHRVVRRIERQSRSLLAVETGAFRRDPLRMTPDHVCLAVRKEDARRALPYIGYSADRNGLRIVSRRLKCRRKPLALTETRADSLEIGDFLLFPIIPDAARASMPLSHPVLRRCGKSKALPPLEALPATRGVAWLCGLWLAEGHVGGGRSVRFSFSVKERDTLARRTERILGGLGCDARPHIHAHKAVIITSRTDLADILTHWFGRGAAGKHIPQAILRWPSRLQRALIAGYMAGDGDQRQHANTVSPHLAYGLFALMAQAGFRPTVSLSPGWVGRDGVRHRPCWSVVAHQRLRLDGFYERVGDTLYYWSRITRITKLPGTHSVVDISVNPSHTFVTKMCALHNCGKHGDIVDMAQHLEGHLDFTAALRALADRLQVPWPDHQPAKSEDPSGVLTLVAKLYAEHLSRAALAYLGSRGFPEPFVQQWRIGYAPPKSPQFLRNLLKEHRITPEAALASGAVVEVCSRDGHYVRDFFGHGGGGYLIFPNPGHRGIVVDLQGRAFPDDGDKPKYLNLPKSRRHLFNESVLPQTAVVLTEGIPDALSCLLTGQPAVAVYGTGGFSSRFVNRFGRCRRVYVAFDLDAYDRGVEVAMQFGLRGRVLVLPDHLGRKGDLNDLLVALGPERFAQELKQLLRTAATGYAMALDTLPADLDRHELFETAASLLAAVASLDPISRDTHLEVLHAKYGLAMQTLRDASREALALLPSRAVAGGGTEEIEWT